MFSRDPSAPFASARHPSRVELSRARCWTSVESCRVSKKYWTLCTAHSWRELKLILYSMSSHCHCHRCDAARGRASRTREKIKFLFFSFLFFTPCNKGSKLLTARWIMELLLEVAQKVGCSSHTTTTTQFYIILYGVIRSEALVASSLIAQAVERWRRRFFFVLNKLLSTFLFFLPVELLVFLYSKFVHRRRAWDTSMISSEGWEARPTQVKHNR